MFESSSPQMFIFILLLILWTLPWKGYALWRSARLKQKWWFVALLVINTAAILEIIYIFFIAPKAEKRLLDANSGDTMHH